MCECNTQDNTQGGVYIILRGGGLHNQVSHFNPRIAYCTIALVSSTGAESAVTTSLLISAGGGKGVWLGSLYGGGQLISVHTGTDIAFSLGSNVVRN